MIAKVTTVKAHNIWLTSGNEARRRGAVEFVTKGLQSGALKPVIDRTFTLDEMADAHRYLEQSGHFGKIVVTVCGSSRESAVSDSSGSRLPPDQASGTAPSQELLSRTAKAAKRAIRAGQFAPTFRLQDLHGGSVALINLIERGVL
jgi:hypothetical protein